MRGENDPPTAEPVYGWPHVGGNTTTNLAAVPDLSKTEVAVPGLHTNHVSKQRLATYLAATHNDEPKALALYAWGRRLSAAFFHDISVLEVALRNSLDSTLADTYGDNWFRLSSALFDQRSYRQIAEAWDRLPAKFHSYQMAEGKIRGRLLASCMFGTWVAMLDVGGTTGLEGPCGRASHDEVWTRDVLIRAFPGANKEAGTADRTKLDRAWVHEQVREVHVLRNRIAHHESLINGYPIPGTNDETSTPVRRSAQDGHAACIRLARMIDRDLALFLDSSSTVADTLAQDPRIGWGFI